MKLDNKELLDALDFNHEQMCESGVKVIVGGADISCHEQNPADLMAVFSCCGKTRFYCEQDYRLVVAGYHQDSNFVHYSNFVHLNCGKVFEFSERLFIFSEVRRIR